MMFHNICHLKGPSFLAATLHGQEQLSVSGVRRSWRGEDGTAENAAMEGMEESLNARLKQLTALWSLK